MARLWQEGMLETYQTSTSNRMFLCLRKELNSRIKFLKRRTRYIRKRASTRHASHNNRRRQCMRPSQPLPHHHLLIALKIRPHILQKAYCASIGGDGARGEGCGEGLEGRVEHGAGKKVPMDEEEGDLAEGGYIVAVEGGNA